MTEAQARGLVAVLATAYPGQVLEEPTIQLYAHQLRKLHSFSAAAKAVEKAISSSQFFPSIAALRETYRALYRSELAGQALNELEQAGAGPRELPAEVRAFAQNLRVRGMSRNEKIASDLLAGVERIGPGECADCKQQAELARYGSLELCSRCVAPRIRVAVDLEEQERRAKTTTSREEVT